MLRGPVVCTGLAQDGSPPSGRPFIPCLESLNPLSLSGPSASVTEPTAAGGGVCGFRGGLGGRWGWAGLERWRQWSGGADPGVEVQRV